MGAYPALRRFTPEEYLKFERASATKNEYIDGQIFAMAGGTIDHARISMNVAGDLRVQLKGGPCEVLPADFRIGVSDRGPYFYPDLSVICGAPELLDNSRDCALNPVVVFEVLSKSTRRYDRETKSALYREIPTLRHIVLISQSTVSVEHFFRQQLGTEWKTEKLTSRESSLVLPAIHAILALDGIYDRLFTE